MKHDLDIIVIDEICGCILIRHAVDSRAFKHVTDYEEKATEEPVKEVWWSTIIIHR